jgi:hypothetical protein
LRGLRRGTILRRGVGTVLGAKDNVRLEARGQNKIVGLQWGWEKGTVLRTGTSTVL